MYKKKEPVQPLPGRIQTDQAHPSINIIIDQLLTQFKSTHQSIRSKLKCTHTGHIKPILDNVYDILNNDPVLSGVFYYDQFQEQVMISPNKLLGMQRHVLEDIDLTRVELYISKVYDLPCRGNLNEAIHLVAADHATHPVRDYLAHLEWDGIPRIATLFPRYLGAEKNEYTTEITRLLLLGAISRIYKPGCKYDYMVCICGPQGLGKSALTRLLSINDDWFCDDVHSCDDVEIVQKLHGHWIFEFPEMKAINTTYRIETVKSFITRQVDYYRIPYARTGRDWPRQCVFVGTTDTPSFLPLDRSGNRRFIPLLVNPKADNIHPLADQEECRQYIINCYAEAMEIYKSGNAKLDLSPTAVKTISQLQQLYVPEDITGNTIINWLQQYTGDYVCTKLIYCEAFMRSSVEVANMPTKASKEISNVMNHLTGWEPISQHRFEIYGQQRAWKRKKEVNHEQHQESTNESRNDQIRIPESFPTKGAILSAEQRWKHCLEIRE